jgi:hypothetical protein
MIRTLGNDFRRAPALIRVPVAVQGVGGFWSKIESWFTGYDVDELQKQSAELDAKLAALNQEAKDTGKIDEDTYNATVDHLAEQITATQNIPADIDHAWVEGALEGYKNELQVLESIPEYAGRISGDVLGAITKGVTTGLGAAGKGVLGNLPWWVWVGGVAFLFFYFGGGQVVKYQVGRRVRRYSGQE